MESCIPYWIIIQQDIQNLFNYFCTYWSKDQRFIFSLHSLTFQNIHFVSKHMNMGQDCIMVPIVVGQLGMHSRSENSKNLNSILIYELQLRFFETVV
jgi:hypothetical protein